MAHSATYHLKRYGAGIVLLVALLLATWGVGTWQTARVAHQVQAQRAEAAEEALAYAEAQFARMQEQLFEEAQALAEAPVVVSGLRLRRETGGLQGTEALIEHFAQVRLPAGLAAELYDPTPRLIAWSGFSMPLDDAPNTVRFLDAPQMTVAVDGSTRRALVAWWPLRDGTRAVGAVRVMRLVHFDAPVQNQYLADYTLSEDWTRATGLPVHMELGPEAVTATAPSQDRTRQLEGPDRAVLGRVAVTPPLPERLVERTTARFSDVMALWASLLLLWLMAGLWHWYHAAGRAVSERKVHRALLRKSGRFLVVAAAWWGLRYALLELDVPARWLGERGPLAPLFDPTHLASTVGGGLMRSTGDLLVTAGFAFLLGIAFLHLASRFRNKGFDLFRLRGPLGERRAEAGHAGSGWGTPGVHPSPGRCLLVLVGMVLATAGLVGALAVMTRRAVLDSTFDFFARTGLLPEPLVLVVFCALLLLAIAVLLLVAGTVWIGLWLLMRHWPGAWPRWALVLSVLGAFAASLALLYGVLGLQAVVTWPVVLAFLGVGAGMAAFGFVEREGGWELLTLHRLLSTILLLTVLLYPLLYQGMSAQRRNRIVDAAASFSEGRDPRVLFSMRQALQELQSAPALQALLDRRAAGEAPPFDSLAAVLLDGSLLSSLSSYRVEVALFDARGGAAGRYAVTGSGIDPMAKDSMTNAAEFSILQQMYAERGATGLMIEQITGQRERSRFQYAGLAPVRAEEKARGGGRRRDASVRAEQPAGWIVVRAEPQMVLPETGTPFPRVLLPAGYYGDQRAGLSLAEFRDGTILRSFGRDFGRYRLSEEVRQELRTQPVLWRVEEIKGRAFLTFYQRQEAPAASATTFQPGRFAGLSVTAVRVPALITFDHLYYLLRLAVAGLCIGLPLYLLGLWLRWWKGLLPAPRVRFRDKMLNAFFAVGAVSVVVVGLVGMRVLTGENEQATQRWLRQRLEQVEEVLAFEAHEGESPHRVVERIGIDSLAARLGLDLNMYRGAELVASSRARLVRERLIDERLPAPAYEALYYDGYRFITTEEQVGSFPYTAGYWALTDEEGLPRYVLSIPTLSEQERIEEERARTLAYLFGALLLLVVIVVGTAALLAGALARPIARLRAGLEAVGKGEFARKLPISTRDEIGELVATFNEMRDQLAESRRKLAQQEREVAWREMARQVAHEIKNPLTPMKLSVQHLQRAYKRLEVPEEVPAQNGGASQAGRFHTLFERITSTLVEQIDTLARIANEFSSFARLPTRVLEPLDLNEVIREAVALMREEASAEIVCNLYQEPLVVEADHEELRRVYINLIKNALQAIPKGRRGRVEVATAQDEAQGRRPALARSAVTDNGAGIPPALRGRIFQPNFSTKNSGTGLGLAIVKKSVEEMDGEIGFETEEGAGTTFWIRLPLAENGAAQG